MAHRGTTTYAPASTTGTAIQIVWPTGVQTGDLAFLLVGTNSGTATLTTPTGWTLVEGPISNGSSHRCWLFRKVAAASDSGTTLAGCTLSASGRRHAVMTVMSAGSATTFDTKTMFNDTSADLVMSIPAYTPTVADAQVLVLLANRFPTTNGTVTYPAGYTERAEAITAFAVPNFAVSAATESLVGGPSAQPAENGSFTQTASGIGWLITLAPDAAAPDNWTVDQTDAMGTTDDALEVMGLARVQTDALGLADSAVASMGHLRTALDNQGLSDTVDVALFRLHAVAADDAVGMTDSPTVVQNHARVVTDAAGATDSATVALSKPVSATDAMGTTDAVAVTLEKSVAQTDGMGMSDTVTVALIRMIPITVGDDEGLTDASVVAMSLVRAVTDTAAVSDTAVVGQGHGRSTVDSIAATDSAVVSRGLASLPTDSAGLTDIIQAVQAHARSQTDNLGMTDSVNILLGILTSVLQTDPMGMSDSALVTMTRFIALSPTDTVALSDAATARLSTAVSPVDPMGLGDTATPAMGWVKDIRRNMTLRDDDLYVELGMNVGTLDTVGVSDSALVEVYPTLVGNPAHDPTARFGDMSLGGRGEVVERTGTDRLDSSRRTGRIDNARRSGRIGGSDGDARFR